MTDLKQELEAVRVFLENNARVGPDIVSMQNDMEMVMGYAERSASVCAELEEKIAIRANELMDDLLSNEDMTDFVKKTKINASLAPTRRLLAEWNALDRRLKDTKWLLMQACAIRKNELVKLH